MEPLQESVNAEDTKVSSIDKFYNYYKKLLIFFSFASIILIGFLLFVNFYSTPPNAVPCDFMDDVNCWQGLEDIFYVIFFVEGWFLFSIFLLVTGVILKVVKKINLSNPNILVSRIFFSVVTVFISFCFLFGVILYKQSSIFRDMLSLNVISLSFSPMPTLTELQIIVPSTTEETSGWASSSILVDANIGYTLKDNYHFLYKGEDAYFTKDYKIWIFNNKLSLPAYIYGANYGLSMIFENGSSGGSNNGVDIDSFRAFKEFKYDNSCGYLCKYNAVDKNHNYFNLSHYPKLPDNADAKTFSIIYTNDGIPTDFAKDKNNLYVSYESMPFEIYSNEVDVNSFESLGREYFKDKNKIYCVDRFGGVNILKDADFETFYFDSKSLIGKDKSNIYNQCHIFDLSIREEIDPYTFNVIYEDLFYKDKNHVFRAYADGRDFGLAKLVDADVNTFVYSPEKFFAKDKNNLWVVSKNGGETALVPGADRLTFTLLNDRYYMDSKNVYFYNKYEDENKIKVVTNDIDNFYIPGVEKYDYSVDSNFVYYYGDKIGNADAKSFIVTESQYPVLCGEKCTYDAEDKNHKYLRGKIVK